VILVYLGAVFSATDYGFLTKRIFGWVQLVYSLLLAYALFLTILRARREQLAALFLTACILIVIGCLLETYTGLRAVSDAVRQQIYSFGVYDADQRDEILYGRIRPKLFTSEPSSVTFAYTLFGFAWLLASRWRWKLPLYIGLVGAGVASMPGPTLLLMVVLLVPYYLLLAMKDARPVHDWITHWIKAGILSAFLLAVFAYLATTIYAERFDQIARGDDPSFFYRVIGPALVAMDVIERYPWAGAGLTGEQFIANDVMNVFVSSAQYSPAWRFDKIFEALTNYFWLHWIYLGLVWGVLTLVAVGIWLRVLAPSETLFAWATWVVLGQASGSYVGPKSWTVLLLGLALAAKVSADPAWRRHVLPAAENPGFLRRPWIPAPQQQVWRQ
jgi:hypothetical protein